MVNMSFMDNSTSFIDIVGGINTATDGYFMAVVLLLLAVIFFIAGQRMNYEIEDIALVTSFVISTIALFLMIIGWVSVAVFVIPVVVLLISVFMKII